MTGFGCSRPQPSIQATTISLVSCCTLILFCFASLVAAQNSAYTIESVSAYSLQRTCVQNCLGGLPGQIGCPFSYVYLNQCACRTDLQPSASTFLTGCVNNGCSRDPSDLSSAISLYDSYCVSNGFALVTVPASTTAATSFATVATPGTAAATSTQTGPSPTGTAGSGGGNNESGGNGLSNGARLGLAAGLGVGIPAIVIALLAWWFPCGRRG
jgi:hypothetical protein